jgi:hypothetical protein
MEMSVISISRCFAAAAVFILRYRVGKAVEHNHEENFVPFR